MTIGESLGGASPARAGMYPLGKDVVQGLGGFPRTRGDVPSPER